MDRPSQISNVASRRRQLKISPELQRLLVCPRCKRHPVVQDADELVCGGRCRDHRYPIIDGIPILINDENSVFAVSDYVEAARRTGAPSERAERRVR